MDEGVDIITGVSIDLWMVANIRNYKMHYYYLGLTRANPAWFVSSYNRVFHRYPLGKS